MVGIVKVDVTVFGSVQAIETLSCVMLAKQTPSLTEIITSPCPAHVQNGWVSYGVGLFTVIRRTDNSEGLSMPACAASSVASLNCMWRVGTIKAGVPDAFGFQPAYVMLSAGTYICCIMEASNVSTTDATLTGGTV